MSDSTSQTARAGVPLTGPEMGRYSRHLVLPEVGIEGQERLKGARVLVVGAGGLGSPAALYLAAAGVGTVGLVDADAVDVTNLQRQILHGTSGVGRPKVDSGQERLLDINPHVEVQAHPVRLTSENALRLFAEYDVVVDGCDNFPTRYLVNDACVLTGTPNVYGSVYRWEGQLSLFGTDGGPCYRCLFREPPPPGLIPNCAEAGVFGALPGIIGAAQAMEAIKFVLGVGTSLAGRLQIFDALTVTWRELEIRRDPDCPVCGDQPTQTELIDYDLFCGVHGTEEAPRIQPEELVALMGGEPEPFLLDVREPFEWDICNLADFGAVLIPRGELEARLDEIPRDRPVLIYCRTGGRSRAAQSLLLERGFSDVADLEGGILACMSIDPSIQRY